MKRLLLIVLVILALGVGLLGLYRWVGANTTPSRFTGPVARLGLRVDLEPDSRLPLVLLASITSPRSQTALNAGERVGQDIAVGTKRRGWWERMELMREAGSSWDSVSFDALSPQEPKQLDLAAGESGSVFIAVPVHEAGAGAARYKVRLQVAGQRHESRPVTVERAELLDPVRLTLYDAEIALRSGDAQRALDLLSALGDGENSTYSHTLRARAHEDLEQWEDALEQWRRALSTETSHGRAEPPNVVLTAIARVQQELRAAAQ